MTNTAAPMTREQKTTAIFKAAKKAAATYFKAEGRFADISKAHLKAITAALDTAIANGYKVEGDSSTNEAIDGMAYQATLAARA